MYQYSCVMEGKLTMRVRWGRQCACVSHEVNMCKAVRHVWSVRQIWGKYEAHCNTHGTHEVRGSGLRVNLSIWWFRMIGANRYIGAKCESHSRKSGKIGRNLGKLIWIYSTIPSLGINFQAISVWIVKLGVLTEHHLEVDLGVSFVKQVQCCFSIS